MTYSEMEAEVNACHALLRETDAVVIQALEGLFDCASATAVANYIKDIPESVKSTITQRNAFRQTIADLQDRMDRGDYEEESW